MRHQNFLKPPFYFFIIVTLLGASSCSWISNRRSLFSSNEPEKVNATVPKAQYDELLNKYDSLLRKSRAEGVSAEGDQAAPGQQNIASERVDLMDNLKAAPATGASAGAGGLDGTVSIDGAGNEKISAAKAMIMGDENTVGVGDLSQAGVNDQLKKLEKAKELLYKNQHDAALKMLRELEQSPVNTVKVYSKYLIGEMLFAQGEFDLAMQMFEEVLLKHGHSGAVFKSLGRLIACAEKLKLGKKKDRYYSILHDFLDGEGDDEKGDENQNEKSATDTGATSGDTLEL